MSVRPGKGVSRPATIVFKHPKDMHRWDKFDEKDRFIPYVHHLTYSGDKEDPLRPHDFPEAYGGQFHSFDKLGMLEMRHLALGAFDLDSFRWCSGTSGKRSEHS